MSALDTQVGGNHYRNGTIQPVQFIEANRLQYLEAVVVKRVTRHNQPGGKGRQDIEKAIHELQLLLELRYPPAGAQGPGKVMDKRCLVCAAVDGHGGLPCPQLQVTSIGSPGLSQKESELGYRDTERLQPLAGTSPGIGQKP